MIGVNGGTFDPIHFGHLRPALEVMEALALSQMRFVPVYQPVHRDQPGQSAMHRCRMVELAIQSQSGFYLDRREVDRGGPSYMVDTLHSLKQDFPHAALVLMMGMDAFLHFPRWHDWRGILSLANLVVTHRPGQTLPDTSQPAGQLLAERGVDVLTQPAGQILDLAVTQLAISATDIRQRLARQTSAAYLLPESVAQYITMHQLYQ
ncbi:nicotinate-nicotinamide nucleotide adenylyltransferase [Thiomicrospira sp. WB1]|nr:nicotinate-nicotinamide nucleotide adenylyltransferase [Thiomicrospira sp. WB1]